MQPPNDSRHLKGYITAAIRKRSPLAGRQERLDAQGDILLILKRLGDDHSGLIASIEAKLALRTLKGSEDQKWLSYAIDSVLPERADRRRPVSLSSINEQHLAGCVHPHPGRNVVIDTLDQMEWDAKALEAIHRTVEKLPEAQQAVFKAVHFDGLSKSAAGRKLNRPKQTINDLYSKALHRLQVELSDLIAADRS